MTEFNAMPPLPPVHGQDVSYGIPPQPSQMQSRDTHPTPTPMRFEPQASMNPSDSQQAGMMSSPCSTGSASTDPQRPNATHQEYSCAPTRLDPVHQDPIQPAEAKHVSSDHSPVQQPHMHHPANNAPGPGGWGRTDRWAGTNRGAGTDRRAGADSSDGMQLPAQTALPDFGRLHREIRRGQGSTRARRPRVTNGAGRASSQRQSNAPAAHFPTLTVVVTAAITALIVGAGGELLDRVIEPQSQQAAQAQPAQVDTAGGSTGWTAVATTSGASVVSVQAASDTGRSQGSGVVWDDNGHIVTNHHVIAPTGTPSSEISIAIGNHAYTATLVGSDPATDLAVLKVERLPDEARPIAKANVDDVAIGDDVMAIGSPLGLDGSYTTGIVSALDRPVSTGEQRDQSVVTNAIQTSAPLNPGNSGGALVNARGELIGINSSIATLGGAKSGSIGIGFAIPGDLVANVTDALIQDGKVSHAWLGVSAVDGEQPVGNGAMQMGAEIASVDDAGPGKAAGLQPGDLIVRVGNTDITSATQLVGEVRTYKSGEDVTIRVLRGGQPIEVQVTLGTSPTLG